MRCLVAVAAALALLVAACSRDDEAARAAITNSLIASQELQLSRSQAECVADGFVEQIGVAKLRAGGVLIGDSQSEGDPARFDLPEEEAGEAADVMARCADLQQIFTSALPELPEESRQCVEAELTDQILHEYVASTFMDQRRRGGRELVGALEEECGSLDG